MIHVTVKVFGAFRKYVPSGELGVYVEPNLSIDQIKNKIAEEIRALAPNFSDDGLMKDSVLGNSEGVFSENQKLTLREAGEILALLPPVCGG